MRKNINLISLKMRHNEKWDKFSGFISLEKGTSADFQQLRLQLKDPGEREALLRWGTCWGCRLSREGMLM